MFFFSGYIYIYLAHNCRNLSNEELKETYKIDSSSLRERLMHAIVQATREELEADTEVVYDFKKKKKPRENPQTGQWSLFGISESHTSQKIFYIKT